MLSGQIPSLINLWNVPFLQAAMRERRASKQLIHQPAAGQPVGQGWERLMGFRQSLSGHGALLGTKAGGVCLCAIGRRPCQGHTGCFERPACQSTQSPDRLRTVLGWTVAPGAPRPYVPGAAQLWSETVSAPQSSHSHSVDNGRRGSDLLKVAQRIKGRVRVTSQLF